MMDVRLDHRSKILLAVLAGLVVLAAITGVIRGQMMANAQEAVKAVAGQITTESKNLSEGDEIIAKAKKVHLVRYTKDLSTAKERDALKRARALTDEAEKARNPDRKRSLAASATAELTQVSGGLGSLKEYLSFLDKALAGYKSEPDRLASAIAESETYITSLEKEGYFPEHFAQAKKGLDSARNLQSSAVRLSGQTVERGSPDYLAIYKTCLDGERTTATARQLAASVPETRRANEGQVAALDEKIRTLRLYYNDALVAAVSLERYAPYRILGEVESANRQLSSESENIRSASRQNSMEEQQFKAASKLLSATTTRLTRTDGLFTEAVQRWQKVRSALGAIPGARSSANSAIASAASHAVSYSENSQYSAESLIQDARENLADGDRLRSSDPPKSLNHYHEAKRLADEAYAAVDTSDHDSDSGSSAWDSGSSGGGSTWTGSGSSGSSGGYGGYGGGSSGGGNYGGPSGGGYGGPSGGGYGSGGF